MNHHHYFHHEDEQQIQRIENKLDTLLKELRAFRTEDRIGDEKMSAETQAAIDELTAEVAPISDAVTAVHTTVDRLIAMYEEAGDDPAQIRAVTANLKTEKERIIAAAMKGTPIDPSANA